MSTKMLTSQTMPLLFSSQPQIDEQHSCQKNNNSRDATLRSFGWRPYQLLTARNTICPLPYYWKFLRHKSILLTFGKSTFYERKKKRESS